MRAPARGACTPPFQVQRLDLRDVDGLRPLGPGLFLVRNLRALCERAVAVRGDARVMDEQVAASFIGGDEAEALLVAEPLDCACGHAGDLLRSSKCCYR